MNTDWKEIVKNIAPVIASVLGGPLAGTAVSAVSSAILGKPDGTDGEINSAISVGGPDMLLKLKQADNDFKIKMKELDIDIEQINQQDRASARQREIAVKDKTPKVLAFMIVIGFMAMSVGVLSGFAKVETVLAGTIIGYISAKAELVLTYYFGSSAGSNRKTELMNQSNKK
jgi:hypothetical protein